jgi:hypothetical protein
MRNSARSTRWALVMVVLPGLLLAPGAARVLAAPFCGAGEAPAFLGGLSALANQVGSEMGQPLECEHQLTNSEDSVQTTSTGLAVYRHLTNTPTFTTGYEHWALTSTGLVSWTGGGVVPPALLRDEDQAQLQRAVQTQAAVRTRLRVLGDAFTCLDARIVSYRRSDREPDFVDHWYMTSQLWADAMLLRAVSGLSQQADDGMLDQAQADTLPPASWSQSDATCHLSKGWIFLNRLWDYEVGGAYARSNPTGTNVERGPRFGDDNALAGLALLATAEVTSDPNAREEYVHEAERQADFLLQSGLWDETFGGGFWWNTSAGQALEGKPAESNALTALFLARLYQLSGQPNYRAWALRTLLWLDTILYEPARHLYRWNAGFSDPEHQVGPQLSANYFNYDQALAISAELVANQLDGDPNRLTRARAVGQAVQDSFWEPYRGGYNLQAGIDQVYTAYSAWVSVAQLALFERDGDERWLQMAQRNADALAASMREADGGYAYRGYRCVDQVAPGCESGTVTWAVDHTRDTSAQAWMQHLQAALAGLAAQGT